MPLYRAEGNDPLCLTCTYHLDNTCTYPKRPTAMECTLYSDSRKPAGVVPPNSLQAGMFSKSWFKRNLAWLTLLGLVVLSLLIVLTR